MVENAIETQLQSSFGFSEEDLKSFMESLKQDGQLKLYEEHGSDTVGLLFTFIDFDKFKQ